MPQERFLVTGASGCIGAWVMRRLLDEGADFVATDLHPDQTRAALLMSEDELDRIDWLALDVCDGTAVKAAIRDREISHVVHLAGLQIPFCKASPALGAAVNVTGTANIFEAARDSGIRGLAYASSLAVFGPRAMYPDTPIPDDAPLRPDTLYGAYKVAGEEIARIFRQDWQVGSVGLRPGVVYGVARDQGMSADIAKAILAVAAGRPFHIRFDGPVLLQHADDVAAMFIAGARAETAEAIRCNLRNDLIEVSDFVALLTGMYPEARIGHATGVPLPAATDLDDANLRRLLGRVPHTPLRDAIAADVDRYRDLIRRGLVDLQQLDR